MDNFDPNAFLAIAIKTGCVLQYSIIHMLITQSVVSQDAPSSRSSPVLTGKSSWVSSRRAVRWDAARNRRKMLQ